MTLPNKTTINGLEIELAQYDEVICCDVIKGRFSSSLAQLEHSGVLVNGDGSEELPVSNPTIERIAVWAKARGW